MVYAFDTKFLYSDIELKMDQDVAALVVWDPCWRRPGDDGEAKRELYEMWRLARRLEVPLIGLYSDWFTAWEPSTYVIGTKRSLMFCDAVITDPVGAATFRRTIPPFRVTDPTDTRHRPIIEMDNFLTYGRMDTLAADPKLVENVLTSHPHSKRDIDVCFVGHPHPGAVLFRSYYLDYLEQVCDQNGYKLLITNKVSSAQMEEILLNSRVCFNSALGSQLNCRIYEGASAGCMMLHHHNTMADWSLFGAVTMFSNQSEMKWRLNKLLALDETEAHLVARKGIDFALQHTPEKVWTDVFKAVDKAVENCAATLQVRLAAEKAA